MAAPVDWPAPADLVAGAVQDKHGEIDRYAEALQQRHLEYNGRRYYADRHSLDTITTTLAVVQMLADTDPVPTPAPVAGKWLSADRDPETGQRIMTAMTCADFKGLARALYDRNALLWGARQGHKATVEAMAAGGATDEQILGYDHTAGWPETT